VLSHPYLAQYADPSDEPDSAPYDQTFEDFELSVEEWKENIWNEVNSVASADVHMNWIILEKGF